ncbi:hypothetical protein ACS0TY_030404 [Phlomoides rotata]
MATIPAYLGRPWSIYSTVVVMESYLDSIVQPDGWRAWPEVAPETDMLNYVEFKNRDSGAPTNSRVRWKDKLKFVSLCTSFLAKGSVLTNLHYLHSPETFDDLKPVTHILAVDITSKKGMKLLHEGIHYLSLVTNGRVILLSDAQKSTFEEGVDQHNLQFLQKLVDENLCLACMGDQSMYSPKEGYESPIVPEKITKFEQEAVLYGFRLPGLKSCPKNNNFIKGEYAHGCILESFRGGLLTTQKFDFLKVPILESPTCCLPNTDFDGNCIHLCYPLSLATKAEVLQPFMPPSFNVSENGLAKSKGPDEDLSVFNSMPPLLMESLHSKGVGFRNLFQTRKWFAELKSHTNKSRKKIKRFKKGLCEIRLPDNYGIAGPSPHYGKENSRTSLHAAEASDTGFRTITFEIEGSFGQNESTLHLLNY